MQLIDILEQKFRDAIKEFMRKLSENLKDEFSLYLFGSLARGDYLLNSDVDIIVVTDSLKNMRPWERTVYLRKLALKNVGFDIVCYTKDEFEEAKHIHTELLKVI